MPYSLSKPVFIIGFMGAGKSSVCAHLAQHLGLPVTDLDAAIEHNAATSIEHIFATEGESAFRMREAETLARLAEDTPQLISCGGGVVERAENIDLMKHSGFVVYLALPVECAWERVGQNTARPLAQDKAAFVALHEKRQDLYEKAATITLDVANRTVEEIALHIREELVAAEILSFA